MASTKPASPLCYNWFHEPTFRFSLPTRGVGTISDEVSEGTEGQAGHTEEAAKESLKQGVYNARYQCLLPEFVPDFDGKPVSLTVKAWLGQVQEHWKAHAILPAHITLLAKGCLTAPASERWYELCQTWCAWDEDAA